MPDHTGWPHALLSREHSLADLSDWDSACKKNCFFPKVGLGLYRHNLYGHGEDCGAAEDEFVHPRRKALVNCLAVRYSVLFRVLRCAAVLALPSRGTHGSSRCGFGNALDRSISLALCTQHSTNSTARRHASL